MPRLPRVTARQVVRALEKLGFEYVRQRGSHLTLYNPESDCVVTVPMHARKTLHPNTLKSILRQAGITAERLRDYL